MSDAQYFRPIVATAAATALSFYGENQNLMQAVKVGAVVGASILGGDMMVAYVYKDTEWATKFPSIPYSVPLALSAAMVGGAIGSAGLPGRLDIEIGGAFGGFDQATALAMKGAACSLTASGVEMFLGFPVGPRYTTP